jgi:hypothetical protein
VRPGIQQLLDALHDVPAFVLGPRMDVLAWNRLAAALIADFAAMEPRQRNVLRMTFLDPSSMDLYPDWDSVAAESVDHLRMYAGRNPDDPELTELVGELSVHSREFREFWARHDVREKRFGTKVLRHPVAGEITVQYESLQLPADPEQILVTYSVEPASPSEQALRLLASWSAPLSLRPGPPD